MIFFQNCYWLCFWEMDLSKLDTSRFILERFILWSNNKQYFNSNSFIFSTLCYMQRGIKEKWTIIFTLLWLEFSLTKTPTVRIVLKTDRPTISYCTWNEIQRSYEIHWKNSRIVLCSHFPFVSSRRYTTPVRPLDGSRSYCNYITCYYTVSVVVLWRS